MAKTHKINWQSVLLIPAVFMIVVSGAVIWGTYRLTIVYPSDFPEHPALTVPATEEYRASAISVMEPFLGYVSIYGPEEEVVPDWQLTELIFQVQDEMVRMIVPASEWEAHLSFVLLLDKRQRALSGSRLDGQRAVLTAQQTVDKYPWIKGIE